MPAIKLKHKKLFFSSIFIISIVVFSILIINYSQVKNRFDGTWNGTANQNGKFLVTVQFGRVTDLDITWNNSESSGEFSTSFSKNNLITKNGGFYLSSDIYTFSGVFINDTVFGSFTLRLGPPNEMRSVSGTFNATR